MYPKHETFRRRYFRNGPGGSYYQEVCYSSCPACAFWRAWRALDEFCSGPVTWARIDRERAERDRADAVARGWVR